MKAVLVSRHPLLPIQEECLKKAGIEIVKTLPQLPSEERELKQLIEELKKEGIEAVVAVALPLPLIVQLKQLGMRVILSKQRAIATVRSEKEARRIIEEKPWTRFMLATRSGEGSLIRVLEFEGWAEIKEVKIIEELIASP